MATLALCCGFGWGTPLGNTTGVAGSLLCDGVTGTLGTTITIVSGATPDGTGYGLRIGASSQYGWGTNTLGTSKTVAIGSVWIRVSTDPSGNKDIFTQDTAAVVAGFGFTYLPGTDKIRAFNGASTQDSTLTYAANVWVHLQWEANVAGGTTTLKWKLDGVDQTQCDAVKTASTIATLDLGGSGATGAIDYAHLVVSVTGGDYPLGNHRVKLLTVDTGGTFTISGTTGNFQTFTGATPTLSAWNATTARDAVDEVPPNTGSAQDGWAQITTASTDYVEMPMATYTLQSGETIAGARLVVAGWEASAASGTIGFRSWNGTTETTLLAATAFTNLGNNTTSPGWIAKMLTLADINTQGELDALAIRAGFSTDAAPDIGVQAVYVEVAIAVSGDATAQPAVVSAVVSLPRPNVNVAAGPAVLPAVAALPAAHPNVAAGPAAVAAVAALSRPNVNVSAGPAVLAATAALARPAVNVTVGPAVVAVVVTLPTPTVVTAGNATVTPAVVAIVVALPRPDVSAAAGPAVLAVLADLVRPSVSVGAGPAPVAVLVDLPTPTPLITAPHATYRWVDGSGSVTGTLDGATTIAASPLDGATTITGVIE